MSNSKYCLIGTLGLLEHEVSLLLSIFRVSNSRDHVPYKMLSGNLTKAHIVIATIDNEAAMDEWQKLIKGGHKPILVAVTPKELGKFPGHSFSRPFSPSKVLNILDNIFRIELSHSFHEQIFHGETTANQRVFSDADKHEIAQYRALVVDDSSTVQIQLTRELATCHLQADVAETGEQALEMIDKNQYDIIFLDVVLPGIDGYQVCKNIKRNAENKNVPVVMLTSKSSPFDKVRGTMAGCSAYLTKPVDYDKFHQILDQYISNLDEKK